MSPDVVKKKLAAIAGYLDDLRPHEKISFDGFIGRHYEIERILELLIVTASDLVLHLITSRGEPAPSSYRAVFQRAGELGLLSPALSRNLALSAGLRNILAHEYDEIDCSVLHKSIPAALRDFSALIEELSRL